MSDHIGEANEMSDTPRMKAAQMTQMEHGTGDVWRVGCDIERELNAANDDIERLTQKVSKLYEGAEEQTQRIRLLIAERDTARLQSDQKVSLREEFRELLGTDDIEQGVDKVRILKQFAAIRLGYIKQLETENDAMRADLLLWQEQEVKP